MEYDPTQYLGAAPYYLPGRPGYSADLPGVLADELGLDGTGHLVDVGSGPGTVGVQLARLFDHVTLVDPDPDMLAEARSHAAAAGLSSVEFVRATAEGLPQLGLSNRLAADYSVEPFEHTLKRTSFGTARTVFASGRPDIVRDADGVIAGCLSMSYAAPHLFGPHLDVFIAALRELVARHSPTGQFWDWPGDTAILIATRR